MKKIIVFVLLMSGIVWVFGQNRPPRGPAAEKVDLPEPESRIYVEGDYRYIESNGVPNHDTGDFPGRGNPHAILPQEHKWRVPANPKVAKEPTPLERHPFGVALNGIPIDPGTAEYWNRDRDSGWRYEALTGHTNLGIDHSNAHVQPTGAYHYHGVPHGLVHHHGVPDEMTMIGYAADGFPIYSNYGYAEADDPGSGLKEIESSWKVKSGSRPSGASDPGGEYDGRFTADWEYSEGNGDLDEFNGRFGPTPEYPDGIYHYYVTEQFPYVSRMYKGTPDQSFMLRGGPPGGDRRGPRGRPGGPRGPRGPRGADGPRGPGGPDGPRGPSPPR